MNKQVKLEVTMTPETEVTSTVTSNNSNTSCDSDQSQEPPAVSSSSNSSTPTVIPSAATIMRLPNMVSLPNSRNVPTTYISNTMPSNVTTQQSQQVRQGKIYSKNIQRAAHIQLAQSPVSAQIRQVIKQTIYILCHCAIENA